MTDFSVETMEKLFRYFNPAGGCVKVGDVYHDEHGSCRHAWLTINESFFRISFREIDIAGVRDDPEKAVKLFRKPFDALDRIWKDGIEEGRKKERADEMTRLRDVRESALRLRTARAYAAGWNAVASSLDAKCHRSAR